MARNIVREANLFAEVDAFGRTEVPAQSEENIGIKACRSL
jgi:hypothetical protein